MMNPWTLGGLQAKNPGEPSPLLAPAVSLPGFAAWKACSPPSARNLAELTPIGRWLKKRALT